MENTTEKRSLFASIPFYICFRYHTCYPPAIEKPIHTSVNFTLVFWYVHTLNQLKFSYDSI